MKNNLLLYVITLILIPIFTVSIIYATLDKAKTESMLVIFPFQSKFNILSDFSCSGAKIDFSFKIVLQY